MQFCLFSAWKLNAKCINMNCIILCSNHCRLGRYWKPCALLTTTTSLRKIIMAVPALFQITITKTYGRIVCWIFLKETSADPRPLMPRSFLSITLCTYPSRMPSMSDDATMTSEQDALNWYWGDSKINHFVKTHLFIHPSLMYHVPIRSYKHHLFDTIILFSSRCMVPIIQSCWYRNLLIYQRRFIG